MLGFAKRATGALWAFHIEDGCAKPAPEAEHYACLNAERGWAWLHFPISDARARLFIERHEGLPEPARALLLGGERRLQIRCAEGWVFGVLPDWERDLSGPSAAGGRLYFALNDRTVFTLRRHALHCVDDVRRSLERGEPAHDPDNLFEKLLERFFDHAETRLADLTDELDTAEDKLLSGRADPARLKVGPVRRELSQLHREFIALRRALARAPKSEQAAHSLFSRLGIFVQTLDDIDHEAGDATERARLLHEEIGAQMDAAANKSLRLLTILSTLMMPPTLVVGAFGMNVPGVPFDHDPMGFAWACGLCLILVGLAYLGLKWSGVLR